MKLVTERDIEGLYKSPYDSHKGMNGRLLVIGGSRLFHASIFWAADVASRIVDLVHFSSPSAENNDLVRKKAKQGFWNGIVVPWRKVEEYISEDDCILIGPGMPRKEGLEKGEEPTGSIVNRLLAQFPAKRWVIDGGALQEMDPKLLNEEMITTPHLGEFKKLIQHSEQEIRNPKSLRAGPEVEILNKSKIQMKDIQNLCDLVGEFSQKHGRVTVLLKGVKDIVCRGGECAVVEGGNPGMTKGGTGDVLAGLVGALYCKNDAFLAAEAGSLINKRAGDRLYTRVGPYFNASDLVEEVPLVMKQLLGY